MFDVVCTTVNGGIPIFYRKNDKTDSVSDIDRAQVEFYLLQNIVFDASLLCTLCFFQQTLKLRLAL